MQEKYYIVRGNRSGVYFGRITERNGEEVTMADARILWSWQGAENTLEIAQVGVKEPGSCKFSVAVDEITITDAIAIIPCTAEAVKIIKGVKEWKR